MKGFLSDYGLFIAATAITLVIILGLAGVFDGLGKIFTSVLDYCM